jgi:hypothetical protein
MVRKFPQFDPVSTIGASPAGIVARTRNHGTKKSRSA